MAPSTDSSVKVWIRKHARRTLRFWLAYRSLPITTAILGLAGLIAVVNFAPSRPDPTNPGSTQYLGWGNPVFFVSISPL